MYDFLKKIPLFADLSDELLKNLFDMAAEINFPAGHILFHEGDPGSEVYVIEDGQIEIIKTSGGRSILLSVRGAGEVIGEMALIEAVPRTATARVRTDVKLLVIGQDQFDRLLSASPMAVRAILHTITSRLRANETLLGRSEKMAQLGTLTAGLAHDLNNPSSAALRGAEVLRGAMARLQETQIKLMQLGLQPEQINDLQSIVQLAAAHSTQSVSLDPLALSDLQSEIEEWLETSQVENSWELAPILSNLEISPDQLDDLFSDFNADQLAPAINMFSSSATIDTVLQEIIMGAKQISEIVKAMKNYVYLDQAPIQSVDIHEGLDNTLIIMRNKLKKGVSVNRSYAENLPRIQAYASELNQVWTNLIDNAIDAMVSDDNILKTPDYKPAILIRTRLDSEHVVIEIEDNGPGIPAEIQAQIFNPFFTTKARGKGTGLGLSTTRNIIVKHGGEIKIDSRPGRTCFSVRLPVNSDQLKER